ncbi:MAG: hypothetical protein GF330_02085 [Candidatus Eisenbacteria bacterium]|nr:hypothetical protein [Candidatus Eisenbacteria bacterium]
MSIRSLVCLGLVLLFSAATASAQYVWCYDADEIYAEVEGSTVTVFHDAALYNCCPDPFAYTVICEGDTILIEEIEVLTEPCYCVCCHNLWMMLEDVAAGDYLLQFSWYDYEGFEYVQRELEIHVPDIGQGGLFAEGPVAVPGCVESSGVPDTGPTDEPDSSIVSWGTIKLLYR